MTVWLALPGLVMWCATLLLPWQPWRTREREDAPPPETPEDLSDITILIPARNEADVIARTLAGAARQGENVHLVVIDDQSGDATRHVAERAGAKVIPGAPLPPGWAGKLWALEQGRKEVTTPHILLLDADIELLPGVVPSLKKRMAEEHRDLVSIMASLAMTGGWEKLLLPAFVYFFKLLYPFRLSNSNFKGVAAAAGGCVLLKREALEDIGGFGALKGALIDDCTLAKRFKQAGRRTWIGLSHRVISLRRYPDLRSVSAMVTRSAYPQLRFSLILLLVCTALFALAFWLPPAVLIAGGGTARAVAGTALAAMIVTYLPTLLFYRCSPLWALLLPVTATLYIGMTWLSAINYWRGVGSSWKARTYDANSRAKGLDTES